MIWLKINLCIFETNKDTSMKLLENIMETQRNYVDLVDMCSISYYANINILF
jgi:hypothetical protein